MSERQFPVPFGGITHSWEMEPEELQAAVAYLASGCDAGHFHNFAVAVDGHRIYTSALGIMCLRRHRQERQEAS